MIKLYIDSDIILDLLLKRYDYYNNAAELMTKIEKRKYKGYTTPLVIANIHYIMTNFGGKKKSIKNIRKLRNLISILAIDEKIVDEALLSDNTDFEDAIQYITSEENNIDFIITRNKGDFKNSKLPVLNAEEFLRIEK
jgi:predicted nucleic acid-binding protein